MGAPAARTHEHAREWVKLGHEVTVLCGLPNHPDGIIPEKYRGHLLYRETIDGVNVLRCWLYATPNQGVFRRSISFVSFMLSSMICGAFFAPKVDVVAATSPQMLCGFAGYFVALFHRRPFVFEVRDLWPKQIIDLGAVSNPFIIGLLTWVERFMYRHSEAVVTVAEATRDEIIERGFPATKIHTVTNGIDAGFFRPLPTDDALREQYGWVGKTVVMYIGTHGLSHGLTTILDTAELLQPRKDIHFVFVGAGAEREKLMQRAEALYLKNVTFLPMQQKTAMPSFYATADICLVPLKKRKVFLYNIPSKMFEIMACGRPIILGARGQAQKLLGEAGAGIAVEPENPQAYVEAIQKLADNPELRRRFGESGRQHAVAHYSRESKAAEFVAILAGVVKGR
jgi:colanic acid biosynthesis glycosyl transferase WcaI